jgi:2-phosphosulfolactate phosphatase
MHIRRVSLLEGARTARGLAVVLDVFRATTHIAVLLDRGAEAVLPVETVPEAHAWKRMHPDWLLAGERGGRPPEGFDLGNSPHESSRADVAGRTVILTTSAGTRGVLAAAASAETVIAGGFVNASAVLHFIRQRAPEELTLVAMGVTGEAPAPEDEAAAAYFAARLTGEGVNLDRLRAGIAGHPEGRKFLDPANTTFSPEDFHACLGLDTVDVVPLLREDRFVRA